MRHKESKEKNQYLNLKIFWIEKAFVFDIEIV